MKNLSNSAMSDFNQEQWSLINKYFDKIIVLTIERNKNRIEIIKDTLDGINFEIFIGVDGKNLNIGELLKSNIVSEKINEVFIETSIEYMNMKVEKIHINEIACALSHRNIYEHVVKNGLKRVLIFEDDVIPVEENLKYLADTLNQLPNDWEVFYMGHMINNDFSRTGKMKYLYLPNFLSAIGINTQSVIRKKKSYPRDFSSKLKIHGGHTGLHAYAISYAAALKLVKKQTPLKYVADLLLMDVISKNELISYTSKYIFFEQNAKVHSSIWNYE